MREQETDRLPIMCTSAGLRKSRADIDGLDFVTKFLLILMRDGIGNDDAFEAAVVQVGNRISRKNAVDDNSVDFLRAVLYYRVSRLDQSSASIRHIVNNDGGLILNVPDQDHSGHFVGTRPFFVDEGKLQVKSISDTSSSNERMIVSSDQA